jgi:hypothetical protein
MSKRIFLLCLPLAILAACNGPAPKSASKAVPSTDTSLVLKPTPARLAAARPVHNLHCPTDGEAIGSMGPAIPVIYKGREVDLCCPNCVKEFSADPDRYLAVAMADTATGK